MKFGISLPRGLRNWPIFFDIFYREYFQGVELPIDYLLNKNISKLVRKNSNRILSVTDLLESSILRNFLFEDGLIKTDIAGFISTHLKNKYSFSVDSFTLDFGFSHSTKSKTKDNIKIEFLKTIGYFLYKSKKTINLPITLSQEFKSEEVISYYISVIDRIMLNYYKYSVNIYPHELTKGFNSSFVFTHLVHRTNLVRLVYEPDTGNYLTEKLLKIWLEPLLDLGYLGSLIIVPNTINSQLYEAEVKKASTIIEKVKRNYCK